MGDIRAIPDRALRGGFDARDGAGSEDIRRHLDFRDYLRAFREVAAEYEALKLGLARRLGSDIGRYADAKTDFVRHVERRAAAWGLAGRQSDRR